MPTVPARNQGEDNLDFLDRLNNLGTLLTVKELARILVISEKTIYSYVARNMIPYMKIQSSVRFRPKHVAQWFNRKQISPKIAKIT